MTAHCPGCYSRRGIFSQSPAELSEEVSIETRAQKIPYPNSSRAPLREQVALNPGQRR